MTVHYTDDSVQITGDATHPQCISHPSEQLVLGAVMVLHLILVIFLATKLNVWIDEAYTLETTGQGLSYALKRALGFEAQAPLYFIVLTLWRHFNSSAFCARFFSILCTSTTVFLAGKLAKRYLSGVSPALVSAAVAFHPLTIYAAVEARCYALVLLLSALLLLFFYDGYMATKPSAAARRYHMGVAVAALYTYYYLGFILVAGATALLIVRSYRLLVSYLFNMAATAVLFVPLGFITLHQVGNVARTGLTPQQSLSTASRMLWETLWRQLLPVGDGSSLAVIRRWVARLAPPSLVLTLLLRRGRWGVASVVPLTLAVCVGLFYLAIAIRLGPDFMKPQHATVLYLPVLLAALALLRSVGGVRAASIGVAVGLVFYGPYLFGTYAPLAKQGDWIRVSHYIEQHEGASEPILVFKAEFILDFGYHYAGKNLLIPLPGPTSKEHYDLKEMVLQNEEQILRALNGHMGASQRFWLVTSHTVPFRGVDVHPEILEGFVAHRYAVLSDRSFVASRVRFLELRPQIGEETKSRH